MLSTLCSFLPRGQSWSELQPPLPSSNPLILMTEVCENTSYTNTVGGMLIDSTSDSDELLVDTGHVSHDSDFDEPWLAQVNVPNVAVYLYQF